MDPIDTCAVSKVVQEIMTATAQSKAASEKASKLSASLQKEADLLKYNAVAFANDAEGQLALYRGKKKKKKKFIAHETRNKRKNPFTPVTLMK